MWRMAMIPKIRRYNDYYFDGYYKWIVCSRKGVDYVHTIRMAILYWIKHCIVEAKIEIFTIKKSLKVL